MPVLSTKAASKMSSHAGSGFCACTLRIGVKTHGWKYIRQYQTAIAQPNLWPPLTRRRWSWASVENSLHCGGASFLVLLELLHFCFFEKTGLSKKKTHNTRNSTIQRRELAIFLSLILITNEYVVKVGSYVLSWHQKWTAMKG